MKISIEPLLKERIPTFKIGILLYDDIVVGSSPQMLKGRLQFFQEELMITLKDHPISSINGITEWRSVFKSLGIDPSRYRHSAEALYRRIEKGQWLTSINSAVDLNNFFSLKYEIPFGIYDREKLAGPVTIHIGKEDDVYLGINGRENNMNGKLISSDSVKPFGSPIVDSKESVVTEQTTAALQVVYLKPSMSDDEAKQLLRSVEKMFLQVHGGTCTSMVIN